LPFQEGVQTLTKLGLTYREARVYLALVRSGISPVRIISKISNVRREDVYRIIPKLQKKSLVEKIITVPTKFKAVPVQDAVCILLDQRKKYTSELEQCTKKLIKAIKNSGTKENVYEENGQFVLIPGKKTLIQKKSQAIKNVQVNLDIITNYSRYFYAASIYLNLIMEALNRGVQVRCVLGEPKNSREYSLPSIENRINKRFKEYPPFKIRCFPYLITTLIGIFDNNEICIITSPDMKIEDSPALWTNHHSLVELAKSHFDCIWNKSLELQIEKPYIKKS